MLIVKATKDTLNELKVKPLIVETLVFMNDFSRLSLTVPGIRSNQSAKMKKLNGSIRI